MSRFTKIMNRARGTATALLAATLAMAIASSAAAEKPRFVLEELGTLGGKRTTVAAMSDTATIVGWSDYVDPLGIAPDGVHAFIWQRGHIRDLGTLGGEWSEARDVNDNGFVVGVSQTKRGEMHAFIAFKQQMFDLNDLLPVINEKEIRLGWFGTEPPLKSIMLANGINNDGQIVACGEVWGDRRTHGFLLIPEESFDPTPGEARGFDPSILFEPGSYRYVDLGFLPDKNDCMPFCVNDFGAVIGVNEDQGFIWQDGRMKRFDYSTKRRVVSCSLNEVFAAAGWIFDHTGNPQATVWESAIAFAVETRPAWTAGKAFDVSDDLNVVGWAARPGEMSKATLWYRQGDGYVPIDLNQPSIVTVPFGSPVKWIALEQATAIDESMRIAGTGAIADGSARGFLLTPIVTTIPVDDEFGPWSSGVKIKKKGQ